MGGSTSLRAPASTAYSNSPRTAAIRRFIVAGAAPRRSRSATTTRPGVPGRGADCQSVRLFGSIADTAANGSARSAQNRRKFNKS
jgi:hypothetical protein